jgi:hypothetical protein
MDNLEAKEIAKEVFCSLLIELRDQTEEWVETFVNEKIIEASHEVNERTGREDKDILKNMRQVETELNHQINIALLGSRGLLLLGEDK